MKTLDSSLTPLHNVTGFGQSGSLFAQLFYAGEEQFYCSADSCVQKLGNDTDSADWTCQDLKCTCIPKSTFCGAVPITDLSSTLNGLSGSVDISCDVQNGAVVCAFKQSVIDSVFGPGGLTLTGCTFGECVDQAVIDTASNSNSTSTDPTSHSSLGGGVIAGLAVVGGLIGIALLFLILGLFKQRKARRSGVGSWSSRSGGVRLTWTNISYFVASGHSPLSSRKNRSLDDAKTVLDNVSGHIEPGQIMAIMGPSGKPPLSLNRSFLSLVSYRRR